MSDPKQWYLQNLAEQTVKALQRRGHEARFVASAAAAKQAVLALIPEDATTAWGGSVTLGALGLTEALTGRGRALVKPFGSVPPEELLASRRKGLDADYFLTGANAITAAGVIYNIDGTCNRIASMAFGPRHVVIVAGVNKLVPSDEAALERLEMAAAMNAKRLGMATPCALTGECDSEAEGHHMCNVLLVMRRRPSATQTHIFIVGEELGY